MSVVIPAGVQEGGMFQVNTSRGVMQLTVPTGRGLGPGKSFQFQLPPLQQAPQQQRPVPQQQPSLANMAAHTMQAFGLAPPPAKGPMMRVTVPPGVAAGQMIQINVPGKGPMQVAVPAGLRPGSTFAVQTI